MSGWWQKLRKVRRSRQKALLQLGSADGLRRLKLAAFHWAVIEMQPEKLSIHENRRRRRRRREKDDTRFEYMQLAISWVRLCFLLVPWQAENNGFSPSGGLNLSGISKIGRGRHAIKLWIQGPKVGHGASANSQDLRAWPAASEVEAQPRQVEAITAR